MDNGVGAGLTPYTPPPAGAPGAPASGQATPLATVSPGLADGTIARDANGRAIYVLSDGHWEPYDARRAPKSDVAAISVRDLPGFEYRIDPGGKWRLLTRGDLLKEVYEPMVDASSKAGRSPIDEHVVDGLDVDKDGPSAPASSSTQARQELKNLDETDKKNLQEWATMIHKNPWLLPKNPADKAAWLELANAVDNAIATGDWSLPDGIADNKKLGEQISRAMRSWDAWPAHRAEVAAPAPKKADSWLGITVETRKVVPGVSRLLGETGVLVTATPAHDSPAGRAGVRSGDIVLCINGHAVETVADAEKIIGSSHPGSVGSVTVLREGDEAVTLPLTFGEHPPEPAS